MPLELIAEPHPFAELAGIFKDDPMLDEWKQALADYRRKVDEKPDFA